MQTLFFMSNGSMSAWWALKQSRLVLEDLKSAFENMLNWMIPTHLYFSSEGASYADEQSAAWCWNRGWHRELGVKKRIKKQI